MTIDGNIVRRNGSPQVDLLVEGQSSLKNNKAAAVLQRVIEYHIRQIAPDIHGVRSRLDLLDNKLSLLEIQRVHIRLRVGNVHIII